MALLLVYWLGGGAAWFWLIRRYDRIDPEPYRAMLVVSIVGGLISATVAGFFNNFFQYQVLDIADGYRAPAVSLAGLALFVGLNEELCKALVTIYIVKRLRTVDEPIDVVIYAMSVALGFAVIENFYYAMEYGKGVLLFRNLICIPGHVAWAMLWGCGLAKAHYLLPTKPTLPIIAPMLLIAAGLHALYDFIIFSGSNIAFHGFAVLNILVLLVYAHHSLKKLSRESPHLTAGECPECRTKNPSTSSFCSRCGCSLAQVFFDVCAACHKKIPAYALYCPACGIKHSKATGSP